MKPMTQAELSQARSKARQWFERNRACFRYSLPERTDQTWEDVFDKLLDLVAKPFHLDLLSEAFEARMLSERQDHPPSHPMDSSMIRALSAST